MHNIATIYRFKTPFLDLEKEKKNLSSVLKKIEKSVEFDWINFDKKIKEVWKYYEIILKFKENLWEIKFYYLRENSLEYFFPIFKLDIFLNAKFLKDNNSKKNWVKFLNNIFECFDWLTEKEFLIDLNNDFYYKTSFWWTKKYPNYDFSDIEIIEKNFGIKKWEELLKDFIVKYKNRTFVLTRKNSKYYHELHSIILYFIYLVFLMYQNIEKNIQTQKQLKNMWNSGVYEGHIELMKKRLNYVDDLSLVTFKKYKQRLEIFFKLF